MHKIILFIAISQDGFIADENGGVDWLPQPTSDEELEKVGYYPLLRRIDTILMGRKSFDQAQGFGAWAWADQKTYVLTSKPLKSLLDCVEYTNETPTQIANKLKSRESGKDIWLFGGAELAQSFEKDNLIDEVIITLTPQILGKGISLGLSFKNLYLTLENNLMNGMVQQIYCRNQIK